MSTSDILLRLFLRLAWRTVDCALPRQPKGSNSAHTLAIGETQLASMSLQDLERDRESKTCSVVFRGVERVHCVPQSSGRETSAVVHDVDPGKAILECRTDGNHSTFRAAVCRCMHGVFHQIIEYLYQSPSVHADDASGCGVAHDTDTLGCFLLCPPRSCGHA